MRIGDILGAQFITLVLAAYCVHANVLSDELFADWRHENATRVSIDTYAVVQYQKRAFFIECPVIYFVHTAAKQLVAIMGTNFRSRRQGRFCRIQSKSWGSCVRLR